MPMLTLTLPEVDRCLQWARSSNGTYRVQRPYTGDEDEDEPNRFLDITRRFHQARTMKA